MSRHLCTPTVTWGGRALLAALLLTACGGDVGPPPATAQALPAPKTSSQPATAAGPDPLGPRPEPASPPPFKPPAPEVFTAAGVNVWLLQRHAVPVVSVVLAVPSGSAADPKGKEGLAYITADMLDEGAGGRDALELAKAVETLGARLTTSATVDGTFVSLHVLKKNLPEAMGLFGDVVVRPKFAAGEWKRVHDLWKNDLKARSADPESVLQVVARRALFGSEHPYGHPISGFTRSAAAIGLGDVRQAYEGAFRPDRATVVAVGDIEKGELATLLEKALGPWKTPKGPPATPVNPPVFLPSPPAFVLVDRPEAPQAIVAFARLGIGAGHVDAAPLSRVNAALGGSFTSRLNQDLREEHGWTYGARSRVAFTRGVGSIMGWAAVFTDKTGDALKALLADTRGFAKDGLTDDEVQKTARQARAELVEVYERTDTTAHTLANNVVAGLAAGHEAEAAVARDRAGPADLKRLAGHYFNLDHAAVVIVGPKTTILPQLEGLDLPKPELRDEEGAVSASKK